MIVMKFGGTSVGSAERFRGVIEIVSKTHNSDDVVVVLSAMSAVTNNLIAAANKAVNRDLKGALALLATITDMHIEAVEALFTKSERSMTLLKELQTYFNELDILFKGISYLGELTKRSLDAVSGMGELLSSKILAAFGESLGLPMVWVDARNFMVTDRTFGKGSPLWDKISARAQTQVAPLLKERKIVVTQGFIGATEDGASTTLGRGGSDFSASIIGVALKAEEIQIWTDVDGMMTADPRVVPEAIVIAEVSFEEASELAYFGAKVLHPMTIAPAVEKNIPVRILNTMHAERPGTIIKSTTKSTGTICAIACKKGINAFFVTTPRMLMAHGFLTRVFEVFDKHATPIDLIATSEVSISVTTDRGDTSETIAQDLAEFGEVRVVSNNAIITVVGKQFREKTGIAGQVFDALRATKIQMISGGASEINLSFVVAEDEADAAMRQLHAAFFQTAVARS
ncbi:MAG TPA: lysine-sensitive aspartokinase 3 [Planktothrix sp.]|jgi:aspartate kinase